MPYTFRKSDIPFLDLDIDRGNAFTSWKEKWNAYAVCIIVWTGWGKCSNPVNVLRLAFPRDTALVVGNVGLSEDKKKDVKTIMKALTQHVEVL